MSEHDVRIKRAARAIGGYRQSPEDDEKWRIAMQTPYGTMCMKQATDALAAAYPELHADPPTHWIAPWEATSEMEKAGGWECFDGEYSVERPDMARSAFTAMRDAHLASADLDKEHPQA